MEKIMVASDKEIEEIVKVICHWIPETYAYDMMTEIWDNCVQFSDNESLKETVKLLIDGIENADHIKWDGIEELQ
jgi:hypothetical protein